MNIMEVDRFLNDSRFTETAPRPPVPGEENELQSNGGISTKSSGSHKTHSSGKSERSNKSHSPAATPRRSNLDRTLVGGSLSCSDTKLNGEEDAPLGFEPEGSAECGNTPPFVETNASTPSYLKWAEDLKCLLEDGEGVKLFKQFLDQEQCSNTLEFWFACRGIKLVSPDETDKLASLIKLIYKKYIKGDQFKLDPKIKKGIAEKLKREKYDQSLFDEAQAHIEEVMKNDSYPLFLKSDIYVQFVQNGGESPKSSHTSGSNSVRPLSGPLPTLHEEKELKQEDIKNNLPSTLPLNPNTLAATRDIRVSYNAGYNNTPRFKRPEGVFAQPSHPVHRSSFPYHVSYAPASERDSENTSDAHTDDTMSLTDSSIDGRDAPYGSKRWKKSQKVMRNNQCSANRRTGLDQHIPRTQRPAPRDRNLAETDPKAFAAILISKLEAHLKDTDNEAYVKSLDLEATDEECDKERNNMPSSSSNQQPNNKNTLTALMAMMEAKDEDPQGILDEHFNRIFDSSSGQTPSRSPGRHSPDRNLLSKSHFLGPSPNVSGTVHYPSFSLSGNKSIHLSDSSFNMTSKSHHLDTSGLGGAVSKGGHHRSKKDKQQDGMSLSFDAAGDSYFEDPHFNAKHSVQIHHHHHHHHHTKDNKIRMAASDHEQLNHPGGKGNPMSRYTGGVDRVSSTVVYDDRSRAKELARQASSGKRMSESTTGDSGVYLSVYDQPLRVPNMHDPSNEKVLNWMLDNEKISSGTNNPQYSTDGSDRGSSHKRSHKSGGSSKKTPYDPNRSAPNLEHNSSLSHSYSYPSAVASANTSLQPTQPISQDPSMPLLNPPNPTVQLEEARRRLIDEDKRAQQQVAAAMRQSKSFNAALNSSLLAQQQQQQQSSKDKRGGGSNSGANVGGMGGSGTMGSGSMPPPPLPPRGIPPKHANIPAMSAPLDLSASDDYSGSFRDKRKLPPPVSGSSGNTTILNSSQNSEHTVVGYYFCGESIPYRTTVHSTQVTLGQFKQHISKRGSYRYFFKKASDEFETGVVYEEVADDNDLLPLCEGKIIGKVEKVE